MHACAFAAPWDAPSLAALLATPGVFGLHAGDPPAGFVLLRVAADEAEVLTLAVAPAARRQGLARALLQAGAAGAALAGADTLLLEVAQDNAAARALYAGLGFSEAGRRRGYYARDGASPVDALVLRRTLNSTPAPAYPEPT